MSLQRKSLKEKELKAQMSTLHILQARYIVNIRFELK
jgi:hypothetical protein